MTPKSNRDGNDNFWFPFIFFLVVVGVPVIIILLIKAFL